MKKVAVIGSPGAGKSTFCKRLASATGLPLYHLDALYWKPGWVETPVAEWEAVQREVISGESWIIDGNYGRTLDIRLREADTVIWLQMPRWLCVWRACKRRLTNRDRVRSDMGEGCVERFGKDFFAFLLYIWRFPEQGARQIEARLQQCGPGNLHILRGESDIEAFLSKAGLNEHSFDAIY